MTYCLSQDLGNREKAASFIYSNKDSALFYINKEIDWAKRNNYTLKLLEALSDKSSIASYYSDLSILQKSVSEEQLVFRKLPDSIIYSDKGFKYKCKLAYDKGLYNYKLNNFYTAKKAFFLLTELIESNQNEEIRKSYNAYSTVANSYLALMYADELKYEVAEEFYNENLRLHKRYNSSETTVYDTKNLIAGLKLDQGDLLSCVKICRESISYYNEIQPMNQINSFISISQILIESYLKLEKIDSAQYFINKTKPYLEKRKRFTNSFNRLQADLYIEQNNFNKAEDEYLKILANLESTDNSFEKIRIYLRLGKLYTLKENNETANKMYNEGLSLIGNEESPGSNYLIKKIELLSESNKILSENEDEKKLKRAVNQGRELISTIDLLKLSFINDGDKQNLINASISGIEYSLDALNKLNNIQENDEYLEAAFQLVENSKNSILLDALTRNKASSFSGIPDDQLEEEKRLRVTIANLQKDTSEESKAELFDTKNEYNNLIELFETEYPRYYQLKYAKNTPTLSELREDLDEKTLFLNFFEGNNAVHIIAISKNQKHYTSIANSKNVSEQIINFSKLLADPKSDKAEIKQVSKKLYDQLLKPLLKTDYQNLVIAADGILHSLPFEALYTGDNYLINQYACTYVNSASLLTELKFKPTNKGDKLLAFAPVFTKKSKNNQLQPLPNNTKEASKIASFFRGDVLKGKAANKSNFTTIINDYNIIHLATHAIIDNETPEYSYLAFSEEDSKESLLYVNDLYATNINANLVTLSACETGLGKLQKGEGMISLSRAFFYAGASSIAHTLWKVNDNASSQIMEGFYKELANGKPKDEALRNAKLNFIDANSDNNYSHPYYWAGFVISGDTAPLTSKNRKWAWFIIILLPTLLVIYNRKRKKAA
ncbi:CHAT domain-containing protein [Spongiivirga sp. MCCC 1A20706]|uniref:CHAT domain-containing protein n=1 Tax=Spongiivirga sp. MCCC 1A20706 TaxID=3160963 RepID=UPI003977382E